MSKDLLLIIKENEGLIYSIAKKFYNNDLEDLYQQGVIGIIKAYKNYKEENNNAKFSTFAYKYIFGEMYNHSMKRQGIKISKDTLKAYKSIVKVQDFLSQKLNREPSIYELSLYVEIAEEEIGKILDIANSILSLDSVETNINSDKNNSVSIDDSYIELRESLKCLDDEERKIIQYRYYCDYTQNEIAEKLNMTQVMVSRYEKKSLQKIKRYFE